MTPDQLQTIHWLLSVSKHGLKYEEQKEEWNKILAELKEANQQAENPIIIRVGEPFSIIATK